MKVPPRRIMKSNLALLSTVVAVASVACVPMARAADWPRWGGPDPGRDMYSPETGLPDHFTANTNGQIEMKSGTEQPDLRNVPNAKWAAKVGSQSYGNVVVADGKVFIGEQRKSPRPAASGRPEHPHVFR